MPTFAEDSFDVIFGGYLIDVRNEYRRLLGINVGDEDIDSLFTQKRQAAMNKLSKKDKKTAKRLLRKRNDKEEMDMSDDEDSDLNMDDDDDDANDIFGDDDAKDQMMTDTDAQKEAKSNDPMQLLSSELSQQFAKYKQGLIDNQISLKVFEYVKEIRKKLPKDTSQPNESADIFPARPGSHLILHDPALEFTKYITLVLGLDDDVIEQVAVLKKNLFRMVDVGGFSAVSQFVNPCMTFVLPDVNCAACKQSRDLDLCRDPWTTPLALQHHDEDMDADSVWNVRCHNPGCNELYNKDLVEAMLLDVVRRRETAFAIQDVLCISCGKAKEDDMSEYCYCSGRFKNKESKKEFEKSMEVFYNIAMHYQFEYLADTVEWITRDS